MAGSPGEATARDMHRRLLAAFPEATGRVPLVTLDVRDHAHAVRAAQM